MAVYSITIGGKVNNYLQREDKAIARKTTTWKWSIKWSKYGNEKMRNKIGKWDSQMPNEMKDEEWFKAIG